MTTYHTTKFTGRLVSIAIIFLFMAFGTACVTTEEGDDVAASGSDRECRTVATSGSKMRQSICMTRDQWARVDARQAQEAVAESQTEDFFRQALEQATQSPPATFNSPTGLP